MMLGVRRWCETTVRPRQLTPSSVSAEDMPNPAKAENEGCRQNLYIVRRFLAMIVINL